MAFEGCISLRSVSIPSGVASVGDMAFFSCKSLIRATVPKSVAHIGDKAFAGSPELTIYCEEGSPARQYAVDNEIDFKPL
jgi:hypothetical protein